MPQKKRRRKPFSNLSEKVTKEYEKKGYSRKKASQIGHATAGKVAQEKKK